MLLVKVRPEIKINFVKQRNPEIFRGRKLAVSEKNIRCTKCNKLLPETTEYFYRDKRKKNGLKSLCKECCIKNTRKWQEENRDKFLEYKRKHREANPKKYREYRRKWSKNNPECHKEFRENNKEWFKDYFQSKRKSDPQYRLNQRIGSNIRMAIIEDAHGRSWEELVGYTLHELKDHLVAQFEPGMTWENHGSDGWHIDHIKPRHKFNFTIVDDQEFKECWALENLRPLWAEDNMTGRPVANRGFTKGG